MTMESSKFSEIFRPNIGLIDDPGPLSPEIRMFFYLLMNCNAPRALTGVGSFIHTKYEPHQANLCLRAFRHDKL